MQTNLLKQKLAAGQPATIIAPFASSAGLVELLGHQGFDGVFLDCEHGPSGWEDLEDMIRAAELAGYSSVVRVERNDAATITRTLDRGAGGADAHERRRGGLLQRRQPDHREWLHEQR